MSGREEMLERIRRALGPTASPSPSPIPTSFPVAPSKLEGVMPPIAPGDVIPYFEAALQKVGGATYRASTAGQLEEILRAILANVQTPPSAAGIVLSRNPLLARLGLAEKLRAWGKRVAVWPGNPAQGKGEGKNSRAAKGEFAAACFSAEVGITGVDFVLAESGSLVLTSQSEGSQLASLAPPVHVSLYRRSQALASLEEVLERLPVSPSAEGASDFHSTAGGRSVVFVTGPSRTADIEQILIRGVHGPREVHAILVEESCLG